MSRPPSLGALRDRVTLLRPTYSREDRRGKREASYTPAGTYPVRVRTRNASERITAGEHRAEATLALDARAELPAAEDDRLNWRGRTLEITGILPGEPGWQVIEAKEIKSP